MALKDLLLSGFPEYCESLPSGREVCFRPMVVSEEKSLMLAKTSQDKSTILNTLQLNNYNILLVFYKLVTNNNKLIIDIFKFFQSR